MSIFKLKHDAMIHRATSMARKMKGMAAKSFDVAWVAEELWDKVAIPTILYACEITEISPRVMKAIEGIHAQMAAFILGVNGNCSHAAILREIGWESLTCKMFKRKIKYSLRHNTFLLTTPKCPSKTYTCIKISQYLSIKHI